jgi:TRAP-type C4-dicarboxylate transport system substrate-binding protein
MARIRDEIVHPILAAEAEKDGYHVLGVWENGIRHITNSTRPIVKPEDLAGIKLRVPNGVWRVKMFETYGANPSPLAFSEVFVALQTGVMDGQENPYAQIYPARFYEVQTYLSNTGHVYTPAYLTAGRSFDRLPEDVRQILAETAREVEPEILALAERLDAELLAKLKEAGIKVNEADKEAFIAASKPIYEQFAAEVEGGGALIEKALALGGES